MTHIMALWARGNLCSWLPFVFISKHQIFESLFRINPSLLIPHETKLKKKSNWKVLTFLFILKKWNSDRNRMFAATNYFFKPQKKRFFIGILIYLKLGSSHCVWEIKLFGSLRKVVAPELCLLTDQRLIFTDLWKLTTKDENVSIELWYVLVLKQN